VTLEIFHHYGIKLSTDEDRKAFSEVGIELEAGARLPWGGIIVGFDLGEYDERWLGAQQVLDKHKITDFSFTKFSKSEFESASSLCLMARSNRGYPQPEENFGYLSATYDLTDYCSKCGNGCLQIKLFRLRSVPVLKRSVMQLNWVFDEVFVSHEVWSEVFKPFGIECWPVIAHRSGRETDSVVQLKIEDRVQLRLKGSNGTDCPVCQRSKKLLDLIGFAPAPISMKGHICRSIQGFGSGAQAFNRVIVSHSLYREIKRAKLRGVQFYPCEPDIQ
jgi:hypothetical protein